MKTVLLLAVSLAMGLAAAARAAEPAKTTEQIMTQERERIYGHDLMTPQERVEYHNRMRALKTEQAREAFRLEHHKLMQARAKEQGKTLPEMPPAGMGPGMMGPGPGPGSGMGPGKGPGPGPGMGPGPRR